MWPETILQWADLALFSSSLLLGAASLVFGLLSWILIDKFRIFTNYLFLNIITLAEIVCISCYILYNVQLPPLNFNDYERNIIVIVIFVLSRIMVCHWMLLSSFYHYLDIVTVYKSRIKKRYSVAHIVATLVPTVEVFFLFLIAYSLPLSEEQVEYLTNIIVGLLIIPNSLIHLKILYTLLKLACHKEERGDLSAPAIVTSGMSLIPLFLLLFLCNYYDELVRNNMRIMSVVNIVGVVMFLSLKKHRGVWAWYWERRRRMARCKVPKNKADRAQYNINMDTVIKTEPEINLQNQNSLN